MYNYINYMIYVLYTHTIIYIYTSIYVYTSCYFYKCLRRVDEPIFRLSRLEVELFGYVKNVVPIFSGMLGFFFEQKSGGMLVQEIVKYHENESATMVMIQQEKGNLVDKFFQ